MPKLLLIAYYFPPDGGAGTQRPAKFCRYLPEFGWDVTVLTRSIRRREDRGRWDPEDESLLQDVQDYARIVRVSPEFHAKEWPPGIPPRDGAERWLASCYFEARELISREPHDCILITMSPFWLSHLGRQLQVETGLPVIYDLRDPWALDGWQPQPTFWRWWRQFRQMRATMITADGVIANTKEAARRISQLFPQVRSLTTITNGYDLADFQCSAGHLSPRQTRTEFLLVHTGTLHGDVLYPGTSLKAKIKRMLQYSSEKIFASGRTVVHLLSALCRLRQSGFELARRLRLVLVGPVDEGTRKCIEQSGVADQVTCTGFVTHSESVDWLLKSNALFLPLHGLPPGKRSLIVPGKTYEYLATGKPILGCLPEGDARDLISGSNSGYCANPVDDHEIANVLKGMLSDWDAGLLKQTSSRDHIQPYERRELTRFLNTFLGQFVSSSRRVELHEQR
jgi:glycosyltransferase involved in cell wall biosynthesis